MAEVQTIAGGDYFMVDRVDYTSADASGVTVGIVMSCFSGTAVIGLLAALGMSAWNTRKSVNPHLFVRSHVAAYFISLLWCDLLQSFGSILNVRWVSMKAVEYGHYCAFQGFIKQSADVSLGIWTLLIALHTFLVVFLRWSMPKRSLFAFFIGGWGFVLLIITIGNAGYKKVQGPFYGIAGYYCWISSNYGNERVTLDYVWLFLSAGLSFVLYALVYLNLRGNVTTKGIHLRRDPSIAKQVDDQSVAIAKQMLIYPVAFTILIFPIAICRFTEWSGHAVSDAASSFADTVYLMAGLVDVTLFVVTRRVLPEHSVIPKSISLTLCKRKKGAPKPSVNTTATTATAAAPASPSDPSLEKGDVEKLDLDGNPIHVELGDAMFKRASSPDSEHDSDSEHQVTIRVQSVVVDRIYMQPDHEHEGPATPPGLTPRTAELHEVSLDSAKGVREISRGSNYYASETPPASMSARSALGLGRGGPPDSGKGSNFYGPGSAPVSRTSYYREEIPEPMRSSPLGNLAEGVPASVRSPRGDMYDSGVSSTLRNTRRSYTTDDAAGPVRSARDEYFAHDDVPRRDARDDYYAEGPASTVRSARDEYYGEGPVAAVHSARDRYYGGGPVGSARRARDIYYDETAETSHSRYYPQDFASPLRSPRRSMSDGPHRLSYQSQDDEPRRSILHSPYDDHRPSPTNSSHYTDEGEDHDHARSLPSPIHTPRTAPLPMYSGTPQSAAFPANRHVPASAREATFPMSARLPPTGRNWD